MKQIGERSDDAFTEFDRHDGVCPIDFGRDRREHRMHFCRRTDDHGRPVMPALLSGTAHGMGALMLATALSGLFSCAAFATSFIFADARAQPRHGALLTIEARASRGDRN
jgi:hypothetical protein